MDELNRIIASFASLSGDAIAVAHRGVDDDEARVVWVNDAYTKLFGYTPEDVVGERVRIIHHPDYYDEFVKTVRPRFDAGERRIRVETFCITKEGQKVWISLLLNVVLGSEGRYSLAVYHDLTLQKTREFAAMRALSERDEALAKMDRIQDRLLSAINGLEGPFAIWDKNYRLVVSNAAFAPSLMGRDEPLEPGTQLDDFLLSAARSGLFADAIDDEENWARDATERIKGGPLQDITRFTDGRVHKAISSRTSDGDTLVIGTDITELENERVARESYAQQLEEAHRIAHHQAYHDALTGLGNRRYMIEELNRMLAARREVGGQVTAIQIDLDRFKQINDTRGHAVGDMVLKTVANKLKSLVSDDDVLVRVGGDEFVVVCHCADDFAERPAHLADNIVQAFTKPLLLEGHEFRVGTSVGIASTDVSREEDLLTDSDIALYKAKSLGRGRARRFDAEDYFEMVRTKSMSDDFLRGLEASEIVPFYQVQTDAESGAPVGLEVLARWKHPKKGYVGPDQFMPIAEHLEVVDKLDRIIFEKAFEECSRAFSTREAPSLSFNVSHERLVSPGILDAAQRVAAYPGLVAFELLESILLDDADHATALQLDALRDAGVSIELDDFGSGHASIIGLDLIAPDRLKIDRRLITHICNSKRSATIVRSIIDMGHAMDIKVTAEGVETQEQADLLIAMGCDRFQGFLFGKPTLLSEVLSTWWPHLNSEGARAAAL